MAVFIYEGRHSTPGVDRLESVAELLELAKVDGDLFVLKVFLGKEDSGTARTRSHFEIIEG